MEAAERIGNSVRDTDTKLVSAEGSELNVIGQTDVCLGIAGTDYNLNAQVVSSLSELYDIILEQQLWINTTTGIQNLFCKGKESSELNGTNATLIAEHGSKPAFFVGNRPYTLLRPNCSVFPTDNSVKTINFDVGSTNSVYFHRNIGFLGIVLGWLLVIGLILATMSFASR